MYISNKECKSTIITKNRSHNSMKVLSCRMNECIADWACRMTVFPSVTAYSNGLRWTNLGELFKLIRILEYIAAVTSIWLLRQGIGIKSIFNLQSFVVIWNCTTTVSDQSYILPPYCFVLYRILYVTDISKFHFT